jgi:hypothetical protein
MGEAGGLLFCMKLSMDMDCCELVRSRRSRCELARRSSPTADDIGCESTLRGDMRGTCGSQGTSIGARAGTGEGGTGGATLESFRLREKKEPLRESVGDGATSSSFPFPLTLVSMPRDHGPRDRPRVRRRDCAEVDGRGVDS